MGHLMNRIYFYIKHKLEVIDYPLKTLTILICRITWFLDRYLLKTYPLIEECGRCEDCGRNVHDFGVPDKLWKAVYGNEGGLLCYDCFCAKADEIFRFKWRSILQYYWR